MVWSRAQGQDQVPFPVSLRTTVAWQNTSFHSSAIGIRRVTNVIQREIGTSPHNSSIRPKLIVRPECNHESSVRVVGYLQCNDEAHLVVRSAALLSETGHISFQTPLTSGLPRSTTAFAKSRGGEYARHFMKSGWHGRSMKAISHRARPLSRTASLFIFVTSFKLQRNLVCASNHFPSLNLQLDSTGQRTAALISPQQRYTSLSPSAFT